MQPGVKCSSGSAAVAVVAAPAAARGSGGVITSGGGGVLLGGTTLLRLVGIDTMLERLALEIVGLELGGELLAGKLEAVGRSGELDGALGVGGGTKLDKDRALELVLLASRRRRVAPTGPTVLAQNSETCSNLTSAG
jgi:hypothetical protein